MVRVLIVHLLGHRARREHHHGHERQRCYVHNSSHKIPLRFIPGGPEVQLTYSYIRVGGSYRIHCEQPIGLSICLQFRRALPRTPESPVGRTKTVRKSPTKSASTTMESNPKGSSHSSSTGNPGSPIVRLIT
jgi:hypothetical protein